MSISNINIEYVNKLITPNELIKKYPLNENIKNFIIKSREEIVNILYNKSDKKIFVVGPCSIHNIEESKKYALMLKKISDDVSDKILIVMRVYFEKPRTTVGWKGLINDPDLNNTFNVNKGLELARELLIYINSIGLPCGCEFLDSITPHYISDLISWGAIGARTTESQVHRQLVSGISMPIGFKNGTCGNIDICGDAINSAKNKHCFMGIDDDGRASIIKTKGNFNTHIILRGGKQPNYHSNNIKIVNELFIKKGINSNIMIDCSHGNSEKNYKNQKWVLKNVMKQISDGEKSIIGVMIESNINQSKQNLEFVGKDNLKYGVSITDSCINIDETNEIILKSYNILLL